MTKYKRYGKSLAAAGLASGLVQVVAGVAMYLSGVYFAWWSALVSLALLALCIAVATRWYVTRVLEGRSTYLTALLVGFVIAASAGLVYVTYNIVSISFVYPGFLDDMARAELARRQSVGGQEGQVFESLRARTTIGMVVANNLRAFLLFGTVLSALTAIAFRKRGVGSEHRSSRALSS